MHSPPPPLTSSALAAGVRHLVRRDRRLASIVARHGPPPMWGRPCGFRTLVRIILEQQVSLRSAATLFARLDREVPGGLTVAGLLRSGASGLRSHGVTRQKAEYLSGLAAAVASGALDFRRLRSFPDEDVRAALLRVRGLGPWSANVYLLMALRRPDVWPTGDLALHVALAQLRGQNSRPTSAEADRFAQRWRPWRAVAARILWHGYLSDRRP